MSSDCAHKFTSFIAEVDARHLRQFSDEEYKNSFVTVYDEMVAQQQRIARLQEEDRQRYPEGGLQRSYGVGCDAMVKNVHVIYSWDDLTIILHPSQ